MKLKENSRMTEEQINKLTELAKRFNQIWGSIDTAMEEIDSLSKNVDSLQEELITARDQELEILEDISNDRGISVDEAKALVFSAVVKKIEKKNI